MSLLAVPILDTTFVTAVRVLSGRAPSQGGRDHTSHRLVAVGLPQRSAVGILWMLAAAGGAISFLFTRHDVTWGLIVVACFLLALAIFAVYLARVRVYDGGDFARVRDQRFTPLVVDIMYKRRIAEVILDVCLTTLAYYSAYRLRFEGSELAPNYVYFIRSLPIVIACQLAALFIVGGYRGTWRLFGMMDGVIFMRGIIGGTLLSQLVILYTDRYEHYSRSVFVIYAALLMLAITGTRASFRLIGEYIDRRRLAGRRCVIYGTGHASLATVREAFGHEAPRILGFIDDNPLNSHMRVAGYSVLGTCARLLTMITEGKVDCVVLNTHLLDVERLKGIERACEDNEVELLRLDVQLRPLSNIS
jgi:UDP-GlcNAc:undecaprenyl-phosphate GlcNAc-1-phosphate transferase